MNGNAGQASPYTTGARLRRSRPTRRGTSTGWTVDNPGEGLPMLINHEQIIEGLFSKMNAASRCGAPATCQRGWWWVRAWTTPRRPPAGLRARPGRHPALPQDALARGWCRARRAPLRGRPLRGPPPPGPRTSGSRKPWWPTAHCTWSGSGGAERRRPTTSTSTATTPAASPP